MRPFSLRRQVFMLTLVSTVLLPRTPSYAGWGAPGTVAGGNGVSGAGSSAGRAGGVGLGSVVTPTGQVAGRPAAAVHPGVRFTTGAMPGGVPTIPPRLAGATFAPVTSSPRFSPGVRPAPASGNGLNPRVLPIVRDTPAIRSSRSPSVFAVNPDPRGNTSRLPSTSPRRALRGSVGVPFGTGYGYPGYGNGYAGGFGNGYPGYGHRGDVNPVTFNGYPNDFCHGAGSVFYPLGTTFYTGLYTGAGCSAGFYGNPFLGVLPFYTSPAYVGLSYPSTFYGDGAVAAPAPAPRPEETGDDPDTAPPTSTPRSRREGTLGRAAKDPENVRPALRGLDSIAEAVQEELTHRGYFAGKVDGFFGTDSRTALRRFQADHGLAATGLINEASLFALGLN